jgi:virulence-associated protein VapD
VDDTFKHHPKSVPQAYADIRTTLKKFDFVWRQGSVYTTDNEDMANLFGAVMALKALPWFTASIRDIRAFRVEMWSDFTAMIKS